MFVNLEYILHNMYMYNLRENILKRYLIEIISPIDKGFNPIFFGYIEFLYPFL